MNRDIEKISAVARDGDATSYPVAPFSPPELFPELKKIIKEQELDKNNRVYSLVREALAQLGLDKENFGTPQWSPFRGIVEKGNKVVIKPNLVFHWHPLGRDGFLSMVTNASVIRPIIDYLLLETDDELKITICDAPLQSADFNIIAKESGITDLIEYYKNKGVEINLVDIRYEIAQLDDEGIIIKWVKGEGDPAGYTIVDLSKRSAFYPIRHLSDKLEITDYPPGTVARHHNNEKNEYLIGKTILDCDLFINIPKLKTHKKAGITVAMKNLIGINGDKSWIAHHRRGSKLFDGDEFDKFRFIDYTKWHLNAYLKSNKIGISINRFLRRIYRKLFLHGKTLKEVALSPCSHSSFMEGSWYGNDTVWRTILDLNNILFFSDADGRLYEEPGKKYLAIVDGIIAGEKNGPMEQFPRKAGMILGGFNPVAVDYLSATVMGFDYQLIPQIKNGFENKLFNLCPFSPMEIRINSNFNINECRANPFAPPTSWQQILSPRS